MKVKIKIKIEPLFLSHNEYQAVAHATTVYQPPCSRSTKAYSENQVEVLLSNLPKCSFTATLDCSTLMHPKHRPMF